MKISKLLLIPLFLVLISAVSSTLPSLGTKETLGKVEGVEIEAIVQSPSAQETPLQVICVFAYTEGDIFNSPPALPKELNGLLHVDEALNGLITKLRKTNKFKGKFLETLLIDPQKKIPAKKILLIGLGDRNQFKSEMMQMIGLIGMREALRLGVNSYSHASDLKDAGMDSPTAAVAGYVIKGAIEAYRTQKYLKQQNASEPLLVTKVTLLTGPAFFEDSKKGIAEVLQEVSNKEGNR